VVANIAIAKLLRPECMLSSSFAAGPIRTLYQAFKPVHAC
jgi:hypothetical protein